MTSRKKKSLKAKNMPMFHVVEHFNLKFCHKLNTENQTLLQIDTVKDIKNVCLLGKYSKRYWNGGKMFRNDLAKCSQYNLSVSSHDAFDTATMAY